jgi:hypothetical protein
MASAYALEYLGAQYDGGGVGGLVEGGGELGDDITARDFTRDLEEFLARGAVPVVGGDWMDDASLEDDSVEADVRGGTLEGLLAAIGGEAGDGESVIVAGADAVKTVGGTAAAFVTGGADEKCDDTGGAAVGFVTGGAGEKCDDASGTAAAFVTGSDGAPAPAAIGTVAELIA